MDYEVKLEGKTGLELVGDGAYPPIRLDRERGLVVSVDNQEDVQRGRVMVCSNLVAGVAPGTAFSTTPTFCIWNPTGSGVEAILIRSTVAYVSGTLGAGFLAYGAVTQATEPTTGTALIVRNAKLGYSKGKVNGYNGSTLVAAPTIVRAPFSMGPALATTAVFPFKVDDEIKREISVPPGQAFAIQMTGGAGTTPLVVLSLTWVEVPWMQL